MAKLKPAFVKPHGTVTAANASFLVCLVWSTRSLKTEIVLVWVLGMEEGKSSISYLQDVITIVALVFEVRKFVFIILNSP